MKPFANHTARLARLDDECGQAEVLCERTVVTEPSKLVGPDRPFRLGFPIIGVAVGALPIVHRTL